MTAAVRCRRCDATWAGASATHCPRCHGTWPDLAGFDQHHCTRQIQLDLTAAGTTR